MGQVVRNIVGNAIKFTPEGKRITVRTSSSMLPGGLGGGDCVSAILIEVIDQGIGIPTGELDTIFDKFVQSSKTKSGAGALG